METIIVGTDFSVPAQNAVNYAVELSKYLGTRLILVNSFTLPLGGYDSTAPFEMIGAFQDASQKGLQELKEEILKKNYDFGIECFSQMGTVLSVIESAAAKYSADLIVMGMVGEGSFVKRHLIGSSAVSVARKIEIPTFIIPEAVRYHRIEKMCFACDTDKLEEGTLIYTARDLSEVFNAELEIVSVSKGDEELVFDKSETYTFIEKRLQGIKHKQVQIEDADVSKALEYYFKFHTTDLVMVNPQKHSFFHKMFNESITKILAFTIKTPLLLIH